LLKARQYPQHAYRACLGILDLARRYPHPQMETACQVLLTANLLSFRPFKVFAFPRFLHYVGTIFRLHCYERKIPLINN